MLKRLAHHVPWYAAVEELRIGLYRLCVVPYAGPLPTWQAIWIPCPCRCSARVGLLMAVSSISARSKATREPLFP